MCKILDQAAHCYVPGKIVKCSGPVSYNECQLTRLMPPTAPLNPLPWPVRAWSHINVDFAGPFLNHMFLIVIDAGSKWIEAFPMLTSISRATIQQLKTLFAQFGLPDIIVCK